MIEIRYNANSMERRRSPQTLMLKKLPGQWYSWKPLPRKSKLTIDNTLSMR
ncbi:MAG: hypothetical protein ACRCZS_09910 [Chroococcidiopsis sp.]